MRFIRFVPATVLLLIAGSWGFAEEKQKAQRTTAADLFVGLRNNAEFCQQSLQANDYKTLAKGAVGLNLLIELLRSQGDDPAWQQIVGKLSEAAKTLDAAGKKQNAEGAKIALSEFLALLSASEKELPGGKPLPLPRSPGVRLLMDLMEGTLADAKRSVAVGNVAEAKNSAGVLAELGRMVLNNRSEPQWTKLAEGFTTASQAAARSTDEDPKTYRVLLKEVSQRCEACHQSRK